MEIQRRLEQNLTFSLTIPIHPFEPTFSTRKLLCFHSGLHHFLNSPCLPDAFTVGFCVFLSLRICSPVLCILTAQIDQCPSSLWAYSLQWSISQQNSVPPLSWMWLVFEGLTSFFLGVSFCLGFLFSSSLNCLSQNESLTDTDCWRIIVPTIFAEGVFTYLLAFNLFAIRKLSPDFICAGETWGTGRILLALLLLMEAGSVFELHSKYLKCSNSLQCV